ncbi:hypothetical protein FHT77_000821 [Rhizobium sp. BK181]|uniref:hypothetical protein n=1 Tax=Rhizobium sp. BK181 TaxID=2587072 RepID=UPI0016134E4E|nr:hypothetical protein [Rhizobium sp. BK181]MBB3314979.1 hypothetical protein [Rhizobium sp. BK181]
MPASSPDAPLIDRIFEVSDEIRYVALYRRGELVSRQKSQVAGASASESDKYEELFVNPTLLKLARQRGDLDCGGMRFVVIGYGNFHQLVIDLPDGHVSVCFELGSAPLDHWEAIRDITLASG